jgi:hypothetical protein
MNSKPKSIDMGSLIQKVTKRARELLKKKSKPQNKGKSANGTSRYSKSKRQKLLIGGVKVKLDKMEIGNILGEKTEINKGGKAHLVHLLKLQTIKKIYEKYLNLVQILASNEESGTEATAGQQKHEEDIKKILDIIEEKLKSNEINENSNDEAFKPDINNTYNYDIFEENMDLYKLYKLDKEIIALNIFKMFHELYSVNEDEFDNESFKGGKINGGGINDDVNGKTYSQKVLFLLERIKNNKATTKIVRNNFIKMKILDENKKVEEVQIQEHSGQEEDGVTENFLEEYDEYKDIPDEMKKALNIFIQTVKEKGNIKEIIQKGVLKKTVIWQDNEGFDLYHVDKNPIKLRLNGFFDDEVRKNNSKNRLGNMNELISAINIQINDLIENYKSTDMANIKKIQEKINKNIIELKNLYFTLAASKGEGPEGFIPQNVQATTAMGSNQTRYVHNILLNNTNRPTGGSNSGNPVKYKSTGQVVHIMFQNKKYKRVIYVKDKRNTKYCKMNNEYILLSKLKVIE